EWECPPPSAFAFLMHLPYSGASADALETAIALMASAATMHSPRALSLLIIPPFGLVDSAAQLDCCDRLVSARDRSMIATVPAPRPSIPTPVRPPVLQSVFSSQVRCNPKSQPNITQIAGKESRGCAADAWDSVHRERPCPLLEARRQVITGIPRPDVHYLRAGGPAPARRKARPDRIPRGTCVVSGATAPQGWRGAGPPR